MKQNRVPTRVGVCPWLVILMTILMATSQASGQTALDFSEARLREGEQAYRDRRYPEAIDQFRIAAFGFLEHPALLSEALVMLALSQDSAGRQVDAKATVNRLTDVERRFPSYATARLDRAARSDFERRFRKAFPDLFARKQQPEEAPQSSPPAPEPGR